MPTGQVSDEVLAKQVAEGNSTALEILYDHYASTVFGISLKITRDRTLAEDVLQETFWRVWQRAVTYDAQRGSFRAWLFRIARNLAIDTYRRSRARPQALSETVEADPILDQIPDPAKDVPGQAQFNLKTEQVQNAMSALPSEQRQVIELAYFYGMTRQEIAAATGEALGTIHTRARLGLQKLRAELERIDFE